MPNVKRVLEFCSAACAAGAAILWYLSARVKVPHEFPITVTSAHTMLEQVIGANVTSTGSSEQLDDLARAVIKQSRLSGWAAGFAAVSAAFQVTAWFVPEGF